MHLIMKSYETVELIASYIRKVDTRFRSHHYPPIYSLEKKAPKQWINCAGNRALMHHFTSRSVLITPTTYSTRVKQECNGKYLFFFFCLHVVLIKNGLNRKQSE